MKKLNIVSIIIITLWGCTSSNKVEENQKIQIIPIEVNSQKSGEPFLVTSDDGTVYLSWIEHQNDSLVSLQFSKLENSTWNNPKTISSGTNWFVNWADFPSLNIYKNTNSNMAAHWLQMSADGTYDYNIHISQSQDGGTTWSTPFIPHRDGISAEHGFVSMTPLNNNLMHVTWLDGRYTKTGDNQDSHGHGHGSGAMTLRAASVDLHGNLSDEVELDNRVCDCCQTSTTITDLGTVIVVYRDRSEKEIRDIAIVRKIKGQWTSAQKVYNDNWEIAGCPVNGPVVKSNGKSVAVAWFAMNDTIPEVKLAFSNDDGENFALPIRIDEGDPLGRVDLLFLSEEEVLVTWMEQDEIQGIIKGQIINSNGKKNKSFEIATTNNSRRSGFPRMTRNGKNVIIAWTDAEKNSKVKTARLIL